MLVLASLGMAAAQAQPAPPPGGGGGGGGGGGLAGGDPNIPPNLFDASHRIARSPLPRQWVYIPQKAGPPLRTLIVEPAGDGPAPVVIFMHYDSGLDPLQQALANHLAAQGFIVVAPDLVSGLGPGGGNYDSFAFPDEAMRAVMAVPRAEALRRYKAAYAFAAGLPRASGKVASFGCGLGGDLSFQFAAETPGLSAAVVFYGRPPPAAALAAIRAPVLGLYAGDDPAVTGTVAATAATMKKLGKSFEPHTYPGATHFFMSYAVEGGNGPAIAASWPTTVAFLKDHLMRNSGGRGQ